MTNSLLSHPLSLFLITLVISFMGSIQPGMVNVMASRLVLSHGKKYTFYYNMAASIPEVFYAFIAAYFVGNIKLSSEVQAFFTAAAGLILVFFGIYMFYNPPSIKDNGSKYDHPLIKGLFLSMTNPQLIIFWSGIILVYQEYGINLQKDLFQISAFSLGAAVGAFLLLVSYMELSYYFFKGFNDKQIIILNKTSASIILLIGLIAILGLFFP